MRVFAQHGHQPSDKISRGLSEGAISGAVFSARYLSPDKAMARLRDIVETHKGAEILVDPEFFASRISDSATAQLNYLESWGHLRGLRRRELVRSEVVEEILENVHAKFRHLPVTSYISPNIYISQSF